MNDQDTSEGLKGKYQTGWAKGGRKRPPLKNEILYAQSQTSSARAAAAYLNISFSTYKRWAERYGIYTNARVSKQRFTKNKTTRRKNKLNDSLEYIFEGNRPKYSLAKLKRRMLLAGFLIEECGICGYSTHRPSDGRAPLLLGRKDGNSHNWKRDNWELRCFNCEFLVSGTANARILFERDPSDTETTNHLFDDTKLTMEDLHAIRRDAQKELESIQMDQTNQ